MVFIKKILLKGFKSYKDQTTFEPFDARTNVIVGRNGSGKSNFYDAVRFVLCDERFSALRTPTERRGLLHVGGGDAVLSAYVEIHFDNSSGRFPIERDTVVIRRAIGLQKDEYFVDRKHMTKAEVMSFLESAGFSRSNPYYIVQQGRIDALATMKDEERLLLLREVAGTRVYEARRAESARLMAESDSKTAQVDDILAYIGERLAELEEEQRELVEYERRDRRRRAVEHALVTREFEDARDRVQRLEQERAAVRTESETAHRLADEASTALRDAERRMKAAAARIADRDRERQAAQAERAGLLQERAKAELALRDAREAAQRDRERADAARDELRALADRIAAAEGRLGEVGRALRAQVAAEDALRAECESARQHVDALCAKQGRSAQFRTREERDAFLRQEIASLAAQQERFARDRREAEAQIAALRAGAADESEAQRRSSEDERAARAQIDARQVALAELREQRDEVQAQRRDTQRQLYEADSRVGAARSEQRRAEHQLDTTVSRAQAQGLAMVRDIVHALHIGGVYGPVIENFATEPAFFTAVEVTAGSSLFHVVVDTDDTAAQILEELNRRRGGRVTFVPLNRLAVKRPRVPLPDTADAKPLLSLLRYPPELAPVFQHIFGKTALCRTQDVAQRCSKEYRCNCVTTDGDQVNRRGVWTGGFYDPRVSRLDAMQHVRRCRDSTAAAERARAQLAERLAALDAQTGETLGRLRELETAQQQARDALEQLVADAAQQRKDARDHAALLDERERALGQMQLTTQQAQAAQRALEAELGTELLANLTPPEQQQLADLRARVLALEPQLLAAAQARSALDVERVSLESTLNSNLYKRRDELSALVASHDDDGANAGDADADAMTDVDSPSAVAAASARLAEVEALLADVTRRLAAAEQDSEDAQEETRRLRDETEELRTKERDAEADALACARLLEQLNTKRVAAQQRREEAAKKIRTLGTLPAEAAEDAAARAAMSTKQLMRLLRETTDSLKEFAHVNKKARDQYVSFTEQREQLSQRRRDLAAAKASIEDLIAELDAKKDEAIERTFKGVSKNFADVFAELVPGGTASLIMVRRAPTDASQGSSSGGGGGGSSSEPQELYSGVEARVQFPGTSEAHYMHQLSGGQKSLVALALIFAIQRTDPAPFYLFDEVDSSLDATYREAVARLIEKQSREAQFIVTTFRPEIVQRAHKWYGISYSYRVSSINPITKDEALAIVKQEMESAVEHPDDGDGDGDGDVGTGSGTQGTQGTQEGTQNFVPPDLDSQRTAGDGDDGAMRDGADGNDDGDDN